MADRRYNNVGDDVDEDVTPTSPNVEKKSVPTPVKKTPEKAFMDAESTRRALLKVYKAEKLVSVNVSPLYAPYFGRVMRVMINGISVYVKVDGTPHNVPETFADEINGRIAHINRNIARQTRLADVTRNGEGSPGELELYS
jgi:hypothetical protein